MLPRLAELLGAAVVDTATRLSMPSRHPMNASGDEEVVSEADVVLLLDAKDVGRTLNERPLKIASSGRIFGTMPRPLRSALGTCAYPRGWSTTAR